jgi:hypothetical protein
MRDPEVVTEGRVGFLPGAYALIYSTVNSWFRGFYGSATRSIASAFVCVIAYANLWTALRLFDEALAFALMTQWRNAFFIVGVLTCAAVDLAFVETGKADRWATQVLNRWRFAAQHRHILSAALVGATLTVFAWPLLL